MTIKIDNYIHNISLRPGERVKVYAVPSSYSEDGFFIAHWRYGELEPAPACLGCEAALLADVTITNHEGNAGVSGYMAEGVQIDAQN